MLLHGHAAQAQEFGRAEPRESREFANEVRLVEVAGAHRQLAPVCRGRTAQLREQALKAAYAREGLRRHAHGGAERFDEAAMTEARLRGNTDDGHAAFEL